MPYLLTLHPESVCEPVSRIEVDVVRAPGEVLGLRYLVVGRTADLALPPPAASAPADGLWQQTCLEAFIADEQGDGYAELNVAPSTEWAGYRFRGYRDRIEGVMLPPPRIGVDLSAEQLELKVALRLRSGGRRRLGLAAVIEELNGRKSYWALAHPPGPPDFHHAACFALELPPAA